MAVASYSICQNSQKTTGAVTTALMIAMSLETHCEVEGLLTSGEDDALSTNARRRVINLKDDAAILFTGAVVFARPLNGEWTL